MENKNKNTIKTKTQYIMFEELATMNKKLQEEINARKKSEEALKESEIRYRQIVEEAHDIIYRTDNKGFLTYVNTVAKKLTGRKEEEIIGKHFSELIHEDYRKQTIQFYKEIDMNEIKSSYYEVPLETNTDKLLWIEQNVIILKNKDKIIGYQAVARDITERKKYQENLIKAKEEAEEAVKAKSKFLANMSHEIRTPMNGILGLTKLLLKTNLTNKQLDYINAIETSSDTLLVIINDILDLAKVESNKMSFEKKQFKIVNLITSVIDFFEGKAIEKNIHLSCMTDEHLPDFVLGDSIRLNQILYNLLGNAIKFTDKGEVILFVNVIKKERKTLTVKFSIKDTGIGIPKSQQLEIFNAYTQVKGNYLKKYGGTGLGLEIVKKLVEAQDGSISVESKLGKGSTFTFILSFGLPQKTKNQKHLMKPILHFNLDNLKEIKILIAEDNPVNQLVATDLLIEKGVTVDVVNNGKEAIYKLKDNHYHLILMDMQMPVMDGYLAMSFIRTRMEPPKRDIPILALTAHAVNGEIKKCKEAGANDYLSKPFQPNELYLKVTELTKINK